ncbi:hypothetical protein MCAL160_0786 [Mycoplasmopsis californica HAZ160_1]|uniref:Uncharacterized protein n=1 Tax=Mycoplasmopsis californica HAZ160_1 TaxID=1397850 RepID=A0AAT9F8F9_9BACT|nr:hypothetical protein MCAL160_0786 [Mycoplasmopsis californica HAZ160_1]BBG41072.1 hypothetical protein MCAL106_0786 [Mycoplasmopsis californica]BBG41665.1 hypothetical protein MCAL106E_0786 [Mycoplasmopsis californica]BBG42259.1 hypothetical protein MCAL106L_0786 [Mycoplasmopsis californica]BBG42836.1 hypothetical protein MCAL160E_0786 [Mycoplasmopsis californica]
MWAVCFYCKELASLLQLKDNCNVFSLLYSCIFFQLKSSNYFATKFITRARDIVIIPMKNMAHFINFFTPLSLFDLNNSRSPEPTNAPEKPFESGDIINEIIMIKILINIKTIEVINCIVMTPPNENMN